MGRASKGTEEVEAILGTKTEAIKNSYYASLGKRIVFPAWLWYYVEAKAFFYHMSLSAYLLMLVQREMEANNDTVNPFDGEFMKMVMSVTQAKEIREVMNDKVSSSYWVENPEAGRIELKIAWKDEAYSKRMGFINLLSEKGWIYNPQYRCWFSQRHKENKIHSEDIGLAVSVINAIEKRNQLTEAKGD